jgi:hypothetical protein
MGKGNVLNTAQSHALLTWIDGHRADALRLTSARLSQAASQELGRPVTSSNVLHAMKSLGISKPKPVKAEPVAACKCEQMAGVILAHLLSCWPPTVDQIHELRDELRKIAGEPKPKQPALFTQHPQHPHVGYVASPCAADRERVAG